MTLSIHNEYVDILSSINKKQQKSILIIGTTLENKSLI